MVWLVSRPIQVISIENWETETIGPTLEMITTGLPQEIISSCSYIDPRRTHYNPKDRYPPTHYIRPRFGKRDHWMYNIEEDYT